MFFNVIDIDVYRKPPTVGYTSPAYEFVGTIKGTKMDISGDDTIRNNQLFGNVKSQVVCKLLYKNSVYESDELVFPDGETLRVKYKTVHENVLHHISLYLEKTQWAGPGST